MRPKDAYSGHYEQSQYKLLKDVLMSLYIERYIRPQDVYIAHIL